jgi:hypothetical protein
MNTQLSNHKQLPTIVQSYLHKYGLTNWSVELPEEKYYNNIIVVPAIQEYENLRKLLLSISENDPKYFCESLFLFVLNNTASSSQEVKEDNYKSIELLRAMLRKEINDELRLNILKTGLNVGLIDASSERLELPEKDGGVGLARKIGMDLALTIFDYSSNTKNILISLDADCLVEQNYLTSIIEMFNRNNLNAAYVQFEHQLPENENDQLAIICYEIFLRYYVLGIKCANSSFAFPTIGSTMVCDYESYVKVGGMNKRKAAEDFYFLEKLAKIISIKNINNTKVFPSSRASWRVPFGTGRRMTRFNESTHDEYVLYDPKTFLILKMWLEIFNPTSILTSDEYLGKAKLIHVSLYEFLVQNNFKETWNKILESSRSEGQIQKQKIIWFDGFRTLKLVHHLRDNSFPLVNMFDAVDELLKIENGESRIERCEPIPTIETQLKYLNVLRKLT